MPYIIRDTSGTKHPEQTKLWTKFRARATAEGHTISWVLWQLIQRYVTRGIE